MADSTGDNMKKTAAAVLTINVHSEKAVNIIYGSVSICE